MNKKLVLFNHRLKEVQKEHKPNKCEARHRYNWKKQWGPFIKYDADWDGSYLLDLIIYKLEKMYISLDVYSNEVREDLNKRLEVLKQTIELGKKIQKYDYMADSYAWQREHCAHVILVYKKGGFISQKPLYKIIQWHNEESGTDPFERLEKYFGHKEAEQWAKENGYELSDLDLAYTGEWDTTANANIWRKKMKAEAKAEQEDIDKFFKLIARNYRGWWW